MTDLRPYQADLVSRLYASTARRSLMILPTGGGKTRVAAEVIARWPGRAVFIADRLELVSQAREAMPGAGVVIGSDFHQAAGNVTIVGVHTVARRDHRIDASLVIVDEAHMASSATFRKVLAWYPDARIIGLTATAYRYGNGSLADLFDEAIAGPSIPDLVAGGYLCPVRTFASPDDLARAARIRAGEFVQEDLDRLMRGSVLRKSVEQWARIAAGKRTIAFASSKAHANELAEALAWYGPTLVISEDTPRADRRAARERLSAGDLMALVSIDALGVGFDCPPVEVGLMCRPTMSRGVFRQQGGRIMRTAPGKKEAILIDCAGNVGRHGLPMTPDLTSLDGKVVPIPKRGRLVGLQNCPRCLAVFETGSVCPECGSAPARTKRVVRTVAGTLEEVIGIEETGAQGFARTATPAQREAWCRKKLALGWSRPRIAAAHKGIFGCWPGK